MSKTWAIIGGIVLAGVVIGGIFVFIVGKRNISENNSSGSNLALPSTKPVITLDAIYKDDSGLNFSYPKDATVTDITPNDNSYYTLLDIRRGQSSIRITIKDGDFTVPTDASLVGAVNLGKFPAKQYYYKSQGNSVLATVAVNQGIVYLIEGPASPSQGGPKDGGVWEDTQNAIVGSLTFGNSTAGNTTVGSRDSNTIDEGEEVIE